MRIKKFTLGDFTLFLNTLFTFSGQIGNVLVNFGSLYENDLFVDDYFQLIDLKNTTERKKNALRPSKEFSLIEFKNVSFTYPKSEKQALKDINLKIKKGKTLPLLEKTAQEKTLLFISHRFSTVRNADKIYVIDEGKIIEQGTHQQLLHLNGRYAQFFKTQKKGYE